MEKDLTQIAEYKIDHINAWRKQQVDLTEMINVNSSFSRFENVNGVLNNDLGLLLNSDEVNMSATLIENKKSVIDHLNFLSSGELISDMSLFSRHDFISAIKNRRTWLGPVKRITQKDGRSFDALSLFVPYLKKGQQGMIAGVRFHYVDPGFSLIPTLSSWLKNRKTAQAFLFSRHGEEITILNNYQNNKVVYPMEFSQTSRELWLQKMIVSPSGIFHNIDNHGKRVIGYVAKVPDSDWALLIKLDEKEAYSHVQQVAWYIFLIAFLLIMMTGFSLFFIMRHKHMQHRTERLKMGLKQKAIRQHYDYLSKYANDVIILMDGDSNVIEANDRSEKMFGKTRAELIGHDIRMVFDLKDDSVFEEKWNELKIERSLIFEVYGKHANGSIFPVEISSRIIESDARLFIQFIIRDISEKKKADEMIWRYANYDQLTGLPNRRMFSERLYFEILKAQRSHAFVALMFLDLDHFKDVNDTLGHGVGDILLKEVSERLKLCIRGTDTVARLGGDEFTVILAQLDSFQDVERVARNILDELFRSFTIDGHPVHISASIGITIFPEDATETHDLMKNADQAMYAAKSMGGNQYHYFTQSMQDALQTKTHMINDLRIALDNNQFEMVYQPIIDLKTGEICRAEALIRWHHPVYGLINPATFIPIAEDTGLIRAFGDWVFMEVARQVVIWQKTVPHFQVSINISPIQFKKEGIDTKVWFAHLKSLNLSPKAIVVEITEGLLLEINDHIIRQLFTLRNAGIEIALDDFGTGYSSMAYLKKLDIDYVKIDQMFVRNLINSKEDQVLCEAMILMAHKLDIAVVAEGVETLFQLKLLSSFVCDYVQGYYISGPLNEQEFGELLGESRKVEATLWA